ncbi:MAG TPA: 1,4-alpha-glucan branching protein [Streptosporangiaceae bacterium]|jgi:hypothetical protein|nr:1,4-alpha-glucan branching protein [Streptosporangiaceae bacterium]
MAILYETTLVPSKLELLTSWLPAQPWYLGSGHEPELTRVGGFRLDDPEGEVGIQFMVVTDGSGERATTYQVPLTYRASACADADDGLICTAEHGVLGRRWIYDGTCDPVFAAQLVALIQGGTEAQSESVSNTPDPTVISQSVASGHLTAIESAVAVNGPHGTDLRITTADANGTRRHDLIVQVKRVLQPGDSDAAGRGGGAYVAAPWRLPDSTQVRSIFATAQ